MMHANQQHPQSSASAASSNRRSTTTSSRLGMTTHDTSGLEDLVSNRNTLSSLCKDSRPENDDARNLIEVEKHPMLRYSANEPASSSQIQQEGRKDSSSSGEEDDEDEEEDVDNPTELLEKYLHKEQQQEREEYEKTVDKAMSEFVDDVLCRTYNASKTSLMSPDTSMGADETRTRLQQLAGKLYPDSNFGSSEVTSAALGEAHELYMERLSRIEARLNSL